jgi:prolyl-tRNA synthetase
MAGKGKRDEKKITARSEDYSQWYHDIILRAALADYAPVKGCMVIRPHGYAIWELIQSHLDTEFKKTGHENAYFPLFIPESLIEREKEHFEGFAPECAVVTEGGGEKLAEKLYVRPTSEMIIWSMIKKWVQSYRDLPLLLNQWCNVVRWEKRTRLFLRTSEFLWQEGHTAHENEEQAREETMQMIGVYRDFAQDVMAVPVYWGRKTENEKFKGAVDTYSIEAMMQDGKALQAGTSHYLGENFARAFDVQYQSRDKKLEYPHSSSWGVSTRLVGALIMAHSDDQGLILPPLLAPQQVVIVPIYRKDDEKGPVLAECNAVLSALQKDLRVRIDDREELSPGFKFNEWELKGVPLRVEVGPKDLEKGQLCLAKRFGEFPDGKRKQFLSRNEALASVPDLLDKMQQELFDRALEFRNSRTATIDSLDEFENYFRADNAESGFALCHWCGDEACEKALSDKFKTTIRCIPDESHGTIEDGTCIHCNGPSDRRVVLAHAY